MADELDEELERIKQKKEIAVKSSTNGNKEISNITKETEFSKVLDTAKIEIIKSASVEDEKFVDSLKNEIKLAGLKSAQLEKGKQELEISNIALEQNFLKTKDELEQQKQKENKWTNKQKAREYHYNGLKDIMQFVHINNPMCIPLMYIFALLVSPIYLVWTLVLCPIGTLIGGTKDNNRPKIVKGAIYTILCVALVVAVIFAGYAVMHFGFKWL